MIPTLIVEDDFRVARLHAEVVDQVEGFATVGLAHTPASRTTVAAAAAISCSEAHSRAE